MTTLNDMFKPIPVPTTVDFNSTPTEVLTYMKSIHILNVDTEFISEYINDKTPNNPDDEDVYDSCILGDLEVLGHSAENVQEQFTNTMEIAINNPDHPQHQQAVTFYNSGV
jgi:hypothetical protein